MSKNISQLTAATTLNNTDLFYKGESPFGPTNDRSVAWSNVLAAVNANAQLASPNQVTNGAYAGGILSVSSNTTLTYPLPNWIFCDTSSGSFSLTFPVFDVTKCRIGQNIIIINTGSVLGNTVTPKNSSGSQFFGAISPDQTAILTLSHAATDSVTGQTFGSISKVDTPTWFSSVAATVLTNIGGATQSFVDGLSVTVANNTTSIANLNTDKQSQNSHLDSVSVIPATSRGFIVMTNDLGTAFKTATITSTDGSITVTNGNGVSADPNLSINIAAKTPLDSTSFTINSTPLQLTMPLSNIYNITSTSSAATILLPALNVASNVTKGSIILFKNVSNTPFRLENSTGGTLVDVYGGQTSVLQFNDVSTANGSIGIDLIGKGTTIIADATTSRTLSASDCGAYIYFNNSSPITVTAPNIFIGFNCIVKQVGTGQITFAPGSGVTFSAAFSATKTNVQGSACSIVQMQTVLIGLDGDIVP